MLPAPELKHDAERVAALHALAVLDTPSEERFDRLTRLAAQFFDVPIALVSLIDTNRQWFKSCFGLEATETPRDISFCGHTITSDEMLVIENALDDSRFADNPLVTGELNIRFYAGQPLRFQDQLIGTFCLIDREPRKFEESARDSLRDFAAAVEAELNLVTQSELNKKLFESQAQQKKAQEERDRIFTDSLDLLCVAGYDGYFQRINKTLAKTLGYTVEELLATPFLEIVHPDDRVPTQLAIEKVAKGSDVVEFENRNLSRTERIARLPGVHQRLRRAIPRSMRWVVILRSAKRWRQRCGKAKPVSRPWSSIRPKRLFCSTLRITVLPIATKTHSTCSNLSAKRFLNPTRLS